jgi:hypothetical protein
MPDVLLGDLAIRSSTESTWVGQSKIGHREAARLRQLTAQANNND